MSGDTRDNELFQAVASVKRKSGLACRLKSCSDFAMQLRFSGIKISHLASVGGSVEWIVEQRHLTSKSHPPPPLKPSTPLSELELSRRGDSRLWREFSAGFYIMGTVVAQDHKDSGFGNQQARVRRGTVLSRYDVQRWQRSYSRPPGGGALDSKGNSPMKCQSTAHVRSHV